jgi:hypothetical protein
VGIHQLNVAVGKGPVYLEKHSITKIMAITGRCRSHVRTHVMNEPGVVKIPGAKGERFSYEVPESVLLRIFNLHAVS